MKKALLAASFFLLIVGFSWQQDVFAQSEEENIENPPLLFVAYPQIVTPGKNVLLEWKSEGADYCIASGAWKGKKSSTGTMRVKPKKKSTYALQCFSEDGTPSEKISRTISVVKKMPKLTKQSPSVVFEIDKKSINTGEVAILTWEAKGAISCYAKTKSLHDEEWNGLKPIQGSEEVSPEESSTYSLRCITSEGVSSKEYRKALDVTENTVEEKHEEVKEEKKEMPKQDKKEESKQNEKEEVKKDELKPIKDIKPEPLAQLAISLDSSFSVAGKSVTKGEINVELARFTLSAAAGKDVTIGSIYYATDQQLLNIKTFNGTVQIGNTLVLRSSSKVLDLNPPLIIPAGNSITLRVVADVAHDAEGSVSVGITNLFPPANTTNFSYTTGMLPLYSKAIAVKNSSLENQPPVLQEVKMAVSLDMATSLSKKISQGDVGINFGQFKISAAEKDVILKGVRIVSNVSGSVRNTKVYSENTHMGTTLVLGEGYVEFSPPFVVKAFTTKSLRLVADVSSSAKSPIRLGISELVFSPEQKGVVSGTLPLYGSDMTLGENFEESLKILLPSDYPHALTFQRGSVNNRVLVLAFAAPAGAKKVYITSVTYRCSENCSQSITSAKLKDEMNNVYIGNTVFVTKEGGALFTFTLPNPYIIDENTKGTLSLIVDLQKSTPESLGTSSLFEISLESISGTKDNGSALSIAGQPLLGTLHTIKD